MGIDINTAFIQKSTNLWDIVKDGKFEGRIAKVGEEKYLIVIGTRYVGEAGDISVAQFAATGFLAIRDYDRHLMKGGG